MMKRKTFLTTASIALISTMAFSACTNDDKKQETAPSSTSSDGGGETSAPVEGRDAASVSQFINTYYNTLIARSSEAYDNSDDVEKVIRDMSGDSTYEAFATTSDPFTSFDELDAEQARKLADEVQALNPSAELFDYSQMEDKDRLVLNLLNIASSVMLSPISDTTVQITVPEEQIKIKNNVASISYTSMKLNVDGEEQQMSDMLGSQTLDMIYVNDAWKIDGLKTYQNIYANAQASVASDGGE